MILQPIFPLPSASDASVRHAAVRHLGTCQWPGEQA